jgi:YggT family protein
MAEQNFWWDYLHFHLPNYVLSALIYTMFGRFLLGFFVPPNKPNYIYRWFCRLTDWFVRPVAFITPRAMPAVFLPPVAAFWLIMIRLVFFAAMHATGQLPSVPGASH